jgi:hypothetical protein
MAAVADPTGANPPGPVGVGPGYWRYDANGGQWRDDWDPSRPWDLMGENEGDQRINEKQGQLGPTAMPTTASIARGRAVSPNYNPAIAAAYARLHPNLGQEFLSAGEAGLNKSFNPMIARLLGMPVTTGWAYPTNSLKLPDPNAGVLPPRNTEPPVGDFSMLPGSYSADQHAGTPAAADATHGGIGVDPNYVRAVAAARIAASIRHPVGGGPVL